MPQAAPRILLVEDEESVQKMLGYPLRADGYEVVPALDGPEALERFAEQHFDLVILDLMLPRLDGIEVCRRLRARSDVPIVMLTAKGEELDKVQGLEVGADDYIVKPFSMAELRSRVRAVLRRAGRPPVERAEAPVTVGALRIDFERHEASVAGEPIRLTHVEFELLAALARNAGRVLTRERLLEWVWGDAAYRDPRAIDVHVRHLREKIEADPTKPLLLQTVRGSGYRLVDAS